MARPGACSISYSSGPPVPHANRGPDTGGWSGTEGLNMVQAQQLSKTKVVKKISYMALYLLEVRKLTIRAVVGHGLSDM